MTDLICPQLKIMIVAMMQFGSYRPQPPLSKFVEMLWHSRTSGIQHSRERVLPYASLISYSVTQRRYEFGIRAALSASRPSLLRLVLGSGFKLVLIGLAIGLAIAFRMGSILQSILYGIQPDDLYTIAEVALVLISVSLLARIVPALRASKIVPAISLRAR